MDWIRRLVWPTILRCAVGTSALACCQLPDAPVPEYQPLLFPAFRSGRAWSAPTAAVLERLGLWELAQRRPHDAFSLIEQSGGELQSDPQRLLALAELAYQISQTSSPKDAVAWARDAAVYSIFYLARPVAACCDDPFRCLAQAIHNAAVQSCLNSARTDVTPGQSGWPATLAQARIVVASTSGIWSALGIDSLESTNRLGVLHRNASERRDGLGVPLIARRAISEHEFNQWKPYGPGEAVFAATAVLQPTGPAAGWRHEPVELTLVDPSQAEAMEIGGNSYPLAEDLTPALLARLAQTAVRTYELSGVVNPRLYADHAGVYAIDPYQPGKVPVVFVQGLWTGPMVWAPMFEALRRDVTLRTSCQFWFVLYPSGYPLPLAAQSLRRSLREVRQRFDPHGVDAALDQMVIVGKSTGGQVVKMLVAPSGDSIWKSVFAQPLDQIQIKSELRAELADAFFFAPEPYVRRAIFVATGHRGSKLAKQPAMRLGVELIRRNNPLRQVCLELEAANGSVVFQPFFRNRIPSSIDGMQANNPLIKGLDAQPVSSQVAFHSIIACNRSGFLMPLKYYSDGLVNYSSAHLDGAASECIVIANHMCEDEPEVIAEVKRILMLHVYACRR